MASYTENLNLLKKDPVADGADTFNIETMLNENWDKIDKAKGEIDASLSNKAGDRSTTLSGVDLLEAMKSLKPGAYNVSNTCTGTPEDETWWILDLAVSQGQHLCAVLTRLAQINPTRYWATYNAGLGKWSPWAKLATATPPQEFALPVLDGWVGNIRYSKNQFNEVICQVTLTPGSDAAPGMVLGTLPLGFRPAAFIAIPVMALVSGNRSVGQLSVGPDGGIGYYGQTVLAGDSNRIYASFSFLAGA